MGLLGFLFKTSAHQRLAELLFAENLTASVHELALMSDLPYATAHELLQKMEKMNLVVKTKQGRATLFSSHLSHDDLKTLRTLLQKPELSKKRALSDFPEMDLPLVGEFPELKNVKAQSHEELLVLAVLLSKNSPTLLRTLPLLAVRLTSQLSVPALLYWSKRLHVDRELGFLLELTSELSGDKKYLSLARKFKDNRWAKPSWFFENEKNLKGFQALLVEENTPPLAKKWFLRMNMGLDSFKSHYLKFA